MTKKIITIIIFVIITALVVGFTAGTIHFQRLRTEMEDHLAYAFAHIDHHRFRYALNNANDALTLASRLRDNEFINEIGTYIRLLETIIQGNELYDAGNYEAAIHTYRLASEYSANMLGTANDYLGEMISRTERHIHFDNLIHRANIFTQLQHYNEAIGSFEEAWSVASGLSFNGGMEIAAAGVEGVNERIALAKRAEAADLMSTGHMNLNDGKLYEALGYFESALEVYQELEYTLGISTANSWVARAKQVIYEKELEEAAGQNEEDTIGSEVGDMCEVGSEGVGEADGEGGDTGEVGSDTGSGQGGQDSNYDHNRSIDFDMTAFIDDQRQWPANQVRMGATDGRNEGWYNGCGWVAAFNALMLLGNPQHPADIVRHFETDGGMVFGGVLGTYPHAIERLFISMGYDVSHTLFPSATLNIDDAIRKSGTGILAYAHTRAAHFIMVEYREEDGRFIIYNDNLARARSAHLGLDNESGVGAVVDSVDSFLQNTQQILFPFSLITIS